MNQTNHIIGGTVFTGLFSSFMDINVFANVNLLLCCWAGSILPDIDHTKSLIGKVFYPLSRSINRKFGHRTLTHSIMFIVACGFLSYYLTPHLWVVFTLGLFSHLVFDMMTLQGVPLLYPFKKNPFVLPGNPEARMRSGNSIHELLAMSVFITLGIFCYPLMTQGFWNTLNNSIGTYKHLASEFRKSESILYVDFEFRRDFNSFSDSGLLVKLSEKELVFFDTTSNYFVKTLETDIPLTFQFVRSKFNSLDPFASVYFFENSSIQEVNAVINTCAVEELNLYSNSKFIVKHDKNSITTNHFVSKYMNSVVIDNLYNTDSPQKLKIKSELNKVIAEFEFKNENYKRVSEEILKLKNLYRESSDYDKTIINNQIRSLKAMSPPDSLSFDRDKRRLLKELGSLSNEQKFSGFAKVIRKDFG